ncbi:MAG: zinc ribbon domain-containing protein [Candidatus Heimdallarchaeota archaeon]|nr:zinc ribbon domain-containing protein [Candidatus Heimdallarchaeota archaeon]
MSYGHFTHHDPNSKDYNSHVLNIRGVEFCLGCLGSKLFLILVLPILIFAFVYPNYITSLVSELIVLGFLWMATLLVYGMELIRGKPVLSQAAKIITSSYFFTSIFYILVVPSNILNTITISILFAIPQISIYFYKIFTQLEFTHVKIKFISRLSFIVGFFFSLLNFVSNPLMKSTFIILGVLIFIRLRSFSKLRTDTDKYLVTRFADTNSILSRILMKSKIADENNTIVDTNGLRLLSRIYYGSLISLFFVIGVIGVSSDLICYAGASNVLHSASPLLFVPFIAMSSGESSFCMNCGTRLTSTDKFCPSCGNPTELGEKSQPAQRQSRPANQSTRPQSTTYRRDPMVQPQSGGYQQRGYYDDGYGGQRRYGGRRRTSAPIIFGFIVGIIVLLITASLVFAVIMGVVGYFGARLAESVDNPCMAFCIMDTCCDCICSATDMQTRRGRL